MVIFYLQLPFDRFPSTYFSRR